MAYTKKNRIYYNFTPQTRPFDVCFVCFGTSGVHVFGIGPPARSGYSGFLLFVSQLVNQRANYPKRANTGAANTYTTLTDEINGFVAAAFVAAVDTNDDATALESYKRFVVTVRVM